MIRDLRNLIDVKSGKKIKQRVPLAETKLQNQINKSLRKKAKQSPGRKEVEIKPSLLCSAILDVGECKDVTCKYAHNLVELVAAQNENNIAN